MEFFFKRNSGSVCTCYIFIYFLIPSTSVNCIFEHNLNSLIGYLNSYTIMKLFLFILYSHRYYIGQYFCNITIKLKALYKTRNVLKKFQNVSELSKHQNINVVFKKCWFNFVREQDVHQFILVYLKKMFYLIL